MFFKQAWGAGDPLDQRVAQMGIIAGVLGNTHVLYHVNDVAQRTKGKR